MAQFPVHVAKTQLSKLIEQALAGEEVVISRGATPVVRQLPIQPPRRERVPGSHRGELVVGPEFFEPLPADELERWNT